MAHNTRSHEYCGISGLSTLEDLVVELDLRISTSTDLGVRDHLRDWIISARLGQLAFARAVSPGDEIVTSAQREQPRPNAPRSVSGDRLGPSAQGTSTPLSTLQRPDASALNSQRARHRRVGAGKDSPALLLPGMNVVRYRAEQISARPRLGV